MSKAKEIIRMLEGKLQKFKKGSSYKVLKKFTLKERVYNPASGKNFKINQGEILSNIKVSSKGDIFADYNGETFVVPSSVANITSTWDEVGSYDDSYLVEVTKSK